MKIQARVAFYLTVDINFDNEVQRKSLSCKFNIAVMKYQIHQVYGEVAARLSRFSILST